MESTTVGILVNLVIAAGTCGAVAIAYLTNKRSSFENTFNLLLSQHNTALLNLKKDEKYPDKFKHIFKGSPELIKLNERMHELDDYFSSYFRILYHLMKHIHTTNAFLRNINCEKKKYTSMVRAHLDSQTTLLLAINCSHADDKNQYALYKKMIEEYSMLEHLILSKENLLKYIEVASDEPQNNYEIISMIENGDLDKVLIDIVTTYASTAFGTNESIQKFKE
ncbi:Uncharacterised protein [Yersinia intermedia]|uniref:putative phage abortive infection protein n=1 Tax=Yersinia intermedia TaxID=631 RepID=UPI0005E07ACA|nr:putative phage abortive infection protein [Yersinia intermedia]CNH15445.1 Uncharacterised protein [Yersinia intermedia]CQD77898.1 Uncharacterised protein [Yersinia intermedia]